MMTTQVDKHAATELDLYAENESTLYPQFQAIVRNLMRKIRSGKYDAGKAPKLWACWYESAAKRYAKEFASPADWSRMFPKALRDYLSGQRAKDEYERMESGEYDWALKSAKRG